jgi:rhodanese-related sulfurtransferase
MKNLIYSAAISMALIFTVGTAIADSEFPLREKYPNVKPITLEQLNQDYDSTIIVDVRSKEEFDVIHINKALNLPVTKGDFLSSLEKTRAKDGTTDIAFYCNGHTCAKSYKAAKKALGANFENIYCFDAGIFEWTTAYPDKSALLGQTPVSTDKLISKDDLNAHKIGFADFKAKASAKNAMVIDLRDPFQRAKDSSLPQNKNVDMKGIRNIPMDRLVTLIKKGEFKNKQLLIFDAVGKQVRWLQYHLEEGGYSDYFFMAKGVLSAADAGAVK